MYVVTRDDLYLIPTAEVPVTNLHRDEILDAAALPIRYAAYSASFRREAGAAGRDTRGILRVHQFDKVEMVSFVRPEDSAAELEWLTERAESLLQRLGLAYRVAAHGDARDGLRPGQEVRPRGLGAGRRALARGEQRQQLPRLPGAAHGRSATAPRPGAKPELVHTLNGSALALPRTVAAILETYQQADGSVMVPEVLQPAFGGRERHRSARLTA